MRLNIRGKVWKLVKDPLDETLLGSCCHPQEPGKKIMIRDDLEGLEELDTLIHEMLHAAFWDLKEEAVNEAAEDIAKALWRLGYRNDR